MTKAFIEQILAMIKAVFVLTNPPKGQEEERPLNKVKWLPQAHGDLQSTTNHNLQMLQTRKGCNFLKALVLPPSRNMHVRVHRCTRVNPTLDMILVTLIVRFVRRSSSLLRGTDQHLPDNIDGYPSSYNPRRKNGDHYMHSGRESVDPHCMFHMLQRYAQIH